jgi:hypothetical protein
MVSGGRRDASTTNSSSNIHVNGSMSNHGDGIFHSYSDGADMNGHGDELTSVSTFQNFSIDGGEDDDDDLEAYNDDTSDNYDTRLPCHGTSSNNSNRKSKIPPHYICPLALRLMCDPMNDNCGHTFDRQAIFDWLDHRPVCPISRRPMDKNDLFRNGHLKAQIEDWKDRHPDYTSDGNDNSGSDILTVEERHSHSQFELMLLPQERSVLNVVKLRGKARRKRQRFSRCMWCIGISITAVVVGATIVALKFFDLRLVGPLR